MADLTKDVRLRWLLLPLCISEELNELLGLLLFLPCFHFRGKIGQTLVRHLALLLLR